MPKDFAPVPLSELKNLTNGEFYDDEFSKGRYSTSLLYTSDAADE